MRRLKLATSLICITASICHAQTQSDQQLRQLIVAFANMPGVTLAKAQSGGSDVSRYMDGLTNSPGEIVKLSVDQLFTQYPALPRNYQLMHEYLRVVAGLMPFDELVKDAQFYHAFGMFHLVCGIVKFDRDNMISVITGLADLPDSSFTGESAYFTFNDIPDQIVTLERAFARADGGPVFLQAQMLLDSFQKLRTRKVVQEFDRKKASFAVPLPGQNQPKVSNFRLDELSDHRLFEILSHNLEFRNAYLVGISAQWRTMDEHLNRMATTRPFSRSENAVGYEQMRSQNVEFFDRLSKAPLDRWRDSFAATPQLSAWVESFLNQGELPDGEGNWNSNVASVDELASVVRDVSEVLLRNKNQIEPWLTAHGGESSRKIVPSSLP